MYAQKIILKKYILLIQFLKAFKMDIRTLLTTKQRAAYNAQLPAVSALPDGLQTFHALLVHAVRDPVESRWEMNSGIRAHGPKVLFSAVLAVLDA